MKKSYRKIVLGILVLLFAVGCKQQKRVDIFLIGDSTVAEYKEYWRPLTGWGEKLHLYFEDNVVIHDFAISGYTTKMFREDYGLYWRKVHRCLREGSYLLIQFGHNDQKTDSIHYVPLGDYYDNLKKYVVETRAKGAIPVLVTPLRRRKFDTEGHLINTLGKYPAEMRKVAQDMNVPLVDLNNRTKPLIESYGVEGSKKLFRWVEPGKYPAYPDGKEDNSHLSPLGAKEVSKLVAEQLKILDIGLGKYIKIQQNEKK